MTILCCSRSRTLRENLISLFGEATIRSLPDIGQMQDNDLQQGEVLIVDLKYNQIPKNSVFPLPIIALAEIPTFPESLMLLQRGVRGYGNRLMRKDNLAQAIASVKNGQIWLPPESITQLIASVGTDQTSPAAGTILERLSEREQEVARHVAQGMSNQEIAERMHVSLRTVKAHLSSIYEKTGLRNRLELGLRLKT